MKRDPAPIDPEMMRAYGASGVAIFNGFAE